MTITVGEIFLNAHLCMYWKFGSIRPELPNRLTWIKEYKFLIKDLEALSVFATPKTIPGTSLVIKNLYVWIVI